MGTLSVSKSGNKPRRKLVHGKRELTSEQKEMKNNVLKITINETKTLFFEKK